MWEKFTTTTTVTTDTFWSEKLNWVLSSGELQMGKVYAENIIQCVNYKSQHAYIIEQHLLYT